MKILKIDSKEKRIDVIPEILDDLWHLENVIETGDQLSGSTERKIKGKDENQKAERIRMFLTIQVEEAAFHRDSGQLRVNGIILSGKPEELVEIKSHHALEVELGQKISLQKAEWKEHQVERLKRAQKATHQDALLVCILDDETASLGWLKAFNVEPVFTLHNPKTGKRFAQTDDTTAKYLATIIQKIFELKPKKVVIAGPGFTKDEVKKMLSQKKEKIAEQVIFETVNSTGETGFQELVKSGLLEKQVQENQVLADSALFEFFLAELGKESGLTEYGFKEVTDAINRHAVSELMVLDSELAKNNPELFLLIKNAEHNKARVHIFNHQTPAGKQLSGFGGIAAMLKFKTNWE